MKQSICFLAAAAAFASSTPPAAADPPTTLPPPVAYTDGSVAMARPECGVGDLCATIAMADGDEVRVYNRGGARCAPFALELITLASGVVVLRSTTFTTVRTVWNSACPRFQTTYVTLDSGQIRMGVFLARDGSLFVRFTSA